MIKVYYIQKITRFAMLYIFDDESCNWSDWFISQSHSNFSKKEFKNNELCSTNFIMEIDD